MAVNWVSEEILLVCDLLYRNGWKVPYTVDANLQELSQLLRLSSRHPLEARDDAFRSPGSVRRKAWDIVTGLPSYEGKPTKGSHLDRIVLNQFLDNPTEMKMITAAIKTAIRREGEVGQPLPDDEFEYEGVEGKLLYNRHRSRERDPKLRKDKILATSRAGLPIACGVCSFDFAAVYGIRGHNYIEVHHVLPLHVSGETRTKISDLALLCSNCHRMIHRGNPWLTPAELSILVKLSHP